MNYKKCSVCEIEKSNTEFYRNKTTKDRLEPYCKICSVKKSKKWKKDNKKKNEDRDYFYNTSEIGFIKNTIVSMFKSKRRTPNITKQEIWEKLILHIQRKKEEFPGTDGRLCDYCNKSWTYARKPPNVVREYKKNIYNFSIDRLDNDITYEKRNIIFCCGKCNDTKHSVTIKLCKRILELYKENNDLE